MNTPEEHPVLEIAGQVRRGAGLLRRMVADTPACAAGFGALVGGLGAMSVLNGLGEARLLIEAFAPPWALVAAAEAAGAAIAWAKAENRIARNRLLPWT